MGNVGTLGMLAALLAAVATAAAVGVALKPARPLSWRIRPYAHLSRTRLGRGADPSAIAILDSIASDSPWARIFGPMWRSLADHFSAIVDVGGDEALALRLRQAGFNDTSPQQYRIRQLAYTVGGFVLGAAVGLMMGSAMTVLIFAALGFVGGVTWWRGRVNKAIKTRSAEMRLEIYTIAHLIAMYLRSGRGLTQAVQAVISRGNGPTVEELAEAAAWMSGGMGQIDAYERLAGDTPEPTAARLYRALAEGVRSGGDLAESLLAISDDLRSERREQVERDFTKRRGAMLLPTIVFMAPVVILWMIAPLPSTFFKF